MSITKQRRRFAKNWPWRDYDDAIESKLAFQNNLGKH